MLGQRPRVGIFIDPQVRQDGIDLDALLVDLQVSGAVPVRVVPGLARHPDLLAGAAAAVGARRAVVVTGGFERALLGELRTWGAGAGLDPLGVQLVTLGILRARRDAPERAAYAARLVRAAAAAADARDVSPSVRRSLGSALTRRALLHGRASTWVPVVDVVDRMCIGVLRCGRCVDACPGQALVVSADAPGGPPRVDPARCGACSRCLDACPAGALQLDGHDPEALARRIRALLRGGDGASAPVLVISCEDAATAGHRAGQGGALPGWLTLEVACLGGIGSAWLLAAVAGGARAVRILPCARCRDHAALADAVDFARDLLAAFGDPSASDRVGVLPVGGALLQRSVRSAGCLAPLFGGAAVDRPPSPVAAESAAKATARVAAWAVVELHQALGPGRQVPPGLAVRTLGPGSPLGLVSDLRPGCTACGVCARTCPSGSLDLKVGGSGALLSFDAAACTGCGLCGDACPEDLLDVTRVVDPATLARGRTVLARVDMPTCRDCGAAIPVLPSATRPPSPVSGLAGRCSGCRQTVLATSIGIPLR